MCFLMYTVCSGIPEIELARSRPSSPVTTTNIDHRHARQPQLQAQPRTLIGQTAFGGHLILIDIE